MARLQAAAAAKAHERTSVERGFWPTSTCSRRAPTPILAPSWRRRPASPGRSAPARRGRSSTGISAAARPARSTRRRRRRGAGAEAAAEQAALARADAAARLEAAAAAAEAARRRIRAAEVYVTAAKAGEEAGAARHRDVQEAEERLDAARLALAQSHFDAARARADWLLADGIALDAPPAPKDLP
ncbi:MAG: hypothetical protein R3F43_12110 [bacterium]